MIDHICILQYLEYPLYKLCKAAHSKDYKQILKWNSEKCSQDPQEGEKRESTKNERNKTKQSGTSNLSQNGIYGKCK